MCSNEVYRIADTASLAPPGAAAVPPAVHSRYNALRLQTMIETARPQPITIGGQEFVWGRRTYVMGIVNVTPDSFSGDGLAYDAAAAVEQAVRMCREGADIIDVGGGPTRPGLAAGACMVNDVHGFRRDPEVVAAAAESGVPAVAMHNQRGREFRDAIRDITAGLLESLRIAGERGLPRERVIVDPGFNFGWTGGPGPGVVAPAGGGGAGGAGRGPWPGRSPAARTSSASTT